MDKYKKYLGIILFVAIVAGVAYYSIAMQVMPRLDKISDVQETVDEKQKDLDKLRSKKITVQNKLKQFQENAANLQKKIYSPTISDADSDTLFFTLYNDLIDMVHSNSVRIKDIKYTHNPAEDLFVKHGGSKYFVCNINLSLVSNYVQLGHLIEDIYQYPYYIKIGSVKIKPYNKDKSVLLTEMSVQLYSYTEPQGTEE